MTVFTVKVEPLYEWIFLLWTTMGNEEYGNEKVILATAGYDHSIRFWQAHNGVSHRTVPHSDSISFWIFKQYAPRKG